MTRLSLPVSSIGLSLFLVACGSTVQGGGDAGHAVSSSSGVTGVSSGTIGSSHGSTVSGGISSAFSPPPVAETKVDILFDIDNSASMGDKQTYLIQAIPEMIGRLVTPQCLDGSGASTGTTADPTTGACPAGSTPEFEPVHDMHIGVVTSSLGPRLGTVEDTGTPVYVCDPTATVTTGTGTTVSAFNDDQGHLINRTAPFGSGPALAEAALPEGGGFLNWFPASTSNQGKTAVTPPAAITTIGAAGSSDTLAGDFAEIVGGAGESGCGIESQLESWYRFLIQPDPYATLVNNNGLAEWSGVDATIIQQRHDFLRPDSVVAVVVLSDENDSEIDVRSFQGSGYQFMSNTFSPPRATSACVSDPSSASCASCLGCGTSGGPPASVCNDPNCTTNGGTFTAQADSDDWGYNLNLRHVHMPQKYGYSVQFPLTRYSNGLTSPTVPNRIGEYPTPASSYTGTNNCVNPLFAATLPTSADIPDAASVSPTEIGTTLCHLTPGASRTPADVFYLHIGGVPHQLLQSTPGDGTCPASSAPADCPQKSALGPADWIKVLGQGAASYTGGALSYDYTGIDPHMVESMVPRNGMAGTVPCSDGTCLGTMEPAPSSNPAVTTLQGPGLVSSASDPVRPDPVNGREWTTYTGVHSLPVDRQYACIFQLPISSQRDCAALAGDTIQGNSCDCVPGGEWGEGMAPGPTGNTPDEIPPLCSMTSTDSPASITSAVSDYTVQTYAKAYPTIRELTLASMLGSQGVISSLCPIHTNDNATGNDPLYGYRPAIDALVSRMKNALPAAM